MPPWFCLAMDLALVSGQRREDLTQMRFNHIVDGRLQVEQGKTGALLSLPLELELKCMGLRLGTVIDRCRLVSTTDFMISASIRKNSPDGSIHPDGLTKKFVAARKASDLEFRKARRRSTRSEACPAACTKSRTTRHLLKSCWGTQRK